jgi:3-oxoacyl-[acyl-carrier-protein] synthase II
MSGCWVAGCGAVSSLGLGVAALFDGWATGQAGIRPLRRFSAARYQSAFAGEVLAQDVLPDVPRFEAMLEASVREAAGQARAQGATAEALSRARVVVATTKGVMGPLQQYVQSKAPADETPGLEKNLTRFLEKFNLAGPVKVISLACASGAAALAYAAGCIESGETTLALVVGVDELSDFVLTGFSSLKSLDPDSCRPFDRDRRGLNLGEAAAAMVLAAPGSLPGRPLGHLLGWGLANDATHLTAPNREGLGLAAACERALARARCRPGDIHYINAHGTGTSYNDAMEAKAMARVFGLPGPPVSTLKGNTGHTLGAAGVLEAIATLKVLNHRLAPPTLGLEHAGVEEPLDLIQGISRPLPEATRALSLSAGFGGFNAALVLGRGEA